MLAESIKKLRKQHKISQEELARKANITYSTLIKIESGANKNPTLETLRKLADTFEISIDQVVGYKKK
jgi:transcriptional regulator with XRE-family HTH domain